MRRHPHGLRVLGLMAVAAGVLGTLAARTEVCYADGLRYIRQAQQLTAGDLGTGLVRALDHPGYPLAIAAVHAVVGGDGPAAWQAAAQATAVLAGVLLVIPLYLVALELFGPRGAGLGCLLVFLAPVPGRVLADALSESTFLLFWCWGLWAALRFLREGALRWLPPLVVFAVLAYLTRPDGLLLPVALAGALLAMPLVPRAGRLEVWRWRAAVGVLVVAPLCLIGPFVVLKGGLGTKPALARVLGLAGRAAADAADRSRPLDPDQTEVETYLLAVKGTAGAVREAVSTPLLPLAVLGLCGARPFAGRPRLRLFLGLLVLGWLLALVRLHVTCGYATARHALIVGLLLILAAGAGLDWLLGRLPRPAPAAGRAAAALAVALYAGWSGPTLLRPLNRESAGYRLAGQWLAQPAHAPAGARVVDLNGWSLFYGQRAGYTFDNLVQARRDPRVRFVVVRDAHLAGPWGYCKLVRDLVGARAPIASFPAQPLKGVARVRVFDLALPPPMSSGSSTALRPHTPVR